MKSEAELDRTISESNHKIEHESLTLNEEKKLLQVCVHACKQVWVHVELVERASV